MAGPAKGPDGTRSNFTAESHSRHPKEYIYIFLFPHQTSLFYRWIFFSCFLGVVVVVVMVVAVCSFSLGVNTALDANICVS